MSRFILARTCSENSYVSLKTDWSDGPDRTNGKRLKFSVGVDCVGLDCVGLDCVGLDCFSLDCVGLDCVGLDCVGLDCFGLDYVGLDYFGLDCVGLDCVGLDCAGLDSVGLDMFPTKLLIFGSLAKVGNVMQCYPASITAHSLLSHFQPVARRFAYKCH